MKLAYLSMNSLQDFECYDSLTFKPMASLGYSVSEVSWQSNTNWNEFDYVVIRSPWDYQDHVDEFMQVLDDIEQSSAKLLNPFSIVKWNINKTYLADLEKSGIDIVPTLWSSYLSSVELEGAFIQFNCSEIIIKPTISANADDTFRITNETMPSFIEEHMSKFHNRQCMIQPFVPTILSEGEFSLFYFNGALSHCILKTPKAGDFRVQEEHGGQLRLIKTPEVALLNAGQKATKAIPEILLYARMDFVRFDNKFVLMEAELIEPSLYFNMDPESPMRFVKAFDEFHRAKIS